MVRFVLLLALVCALNLNAHYTPETINASLQAIGSEETLAESRELAVLLERYESHIPTLYIRYQATTEELARIETMFAEAGIPTFFALIPYPESKFNAKARGYGTAGLWQFSKQSARNFGLTVKKKHDERLDPHRSTEAMIRYVKSLKKEFGSWYLADFAYAMGEGKLKKLIAKNKSDSLSVLLKDPHFSPGAKASFAKTLMLDARIHHAFPSLPDTE